jgi:hypothetical protein
MTKFGVLYVGGTVCVKHMLRMCTCIPSTCMYVGCYHTFRVQARPRFSGAVDTSFHKWVDHCLYVLFPNEVMYIGVVRPYEFVCLFDCNTFQI